MSSINKTAKLAGFLYLLIVPFAILGLLYVPSTLVVPGDAATTASNIMASETLFRLGIVSALIAQIIHIFAVLALYKLLKVVNKKHALLMVIFSLVGVPIAMLSELNQFATLLLLNGAEYLAVFTADQLQALAMMFLELHEYGLIIAWIFWGLWLFPMGYLVFKSGYIPKFLGVLLMIGCFGYLIDFLLAILFPSLNMENSGFTSIGEFLLPLWLLIKGVNADVWEKRAAEVA